MKTPKTAHEKNVDSGLPEAADTVLDCERARQLAVHCDGQPPCLEGRRISEGVAAASSKKNERRTTHVS